MPTPKYTKVLFTVYPHNVSTPSLNSCAHVIYNTTPFYGNNFTTELNTADLWCTWLAVVSWASLVWQVDQLQTHRDCQTPASGRKGLFTKHLTTKSWYSIVVRTNDVTNTKILEIPQIHPYFGPFLGYFSKKSDFGLNFGLAKHYG